MRTATTTTQRPKVPATGRSDILYAVAFGVWIGLALLKFGNPSVFADRIEAPDDPYQFLINPWPLSWGYILMLGLLPIAFRCWHWPREAPLWIIILPAVWFAFQIIASFHTIDSALSSRTLLHFLSVIGAFYLGFGGFANLRKPRWFWLLLLVSFWAVLADGFYQHFLGLEDTRRYFQIYLLPKYPNGAPPELLQKLASNRIYSTLFYPNTFAAVLILCTPAVLAQLWLAEGTRPARLVMVSVTALASLLCLLWSGSKAGWLIAVCLLVLAVTRLVRSRRQKAIATTVLSIAGLAFFAWRYSQYLERGATSAGVRVEYWRAAVRAFSEQPLVGHGPGTFMHTYKRLKPAWAEMARLAHNDYLQQASDSGFPGFLTFSVFIFGSLFFLYRKSQSDLLCFSVWLGLFGASIHALFEFNLYVPAIAWTQFLFFGWLWGSIEDHIKDTSNRLER